MTLHVLLAVIVALSLTVTVSPIQSPFITSNAITHGKSPGTVHTTRYRRQAQPLSPQQIREMVNVHNDLRAEEGANNMELMSWSGFLASLAERWAAGCNWDHGQPPLGSNPQYTSIGQNLFATTGNRINLTSAIGNSWTKNEKQHYDYEAIRCAEKKVCGHYTQVGNSRNITFNFYRASA